MDYKDTLILPETNFAMRGNLPQNEPLTYAKWQESKLYNRLKSANSGKTSFCLHDGPPYANGHIHIGHALNKILKDIIVKFHYFKGENIRYTPGWDCHGLPIEQQIEQKLGKAKKDALEKTKLRELCRNHAREFIAIQSSEFQALGVIGDFDNPYKTMDFAFEAQIYRALIELVKNGLLAQRSKPIYWSWACESALADAEIEYQDKQSDSIFVAFSLNAAALKQLNIESGKLIIWTTTPWTLPANVGLAISKSEKYALSTKGYIVAKPLFEKCQANLDIGDFMREFSPKELEKLVAINPLNGRDSVIILASHVSMEDGTGVVHTATGHGEDDYYVGLEYGLEVIMPVDDKGCFDDTIAKKSLVPKAYESAFIGTFVFDAHKIIFEILGENLLKKEVITHSYPHCWRSHKPVIYRATTQWFILLDKVFYEGRTLKDVALSEIEKTRFYPPNGKNRISSMIANRPDWCISRQRDWGVPIAFFIDKQSNEPLLDIAVLEYIASVFEKKGCDAWWSDEIVDLLPESHKHLSANLIKSKHILDVWFDSGSTWSAVLESSQYDAGGYPADMYLEGSDQHRGWFQSSLLLSCAIAKRAPFRQILTHGFTFDRNGEKMSKSKGNVIAPSSVIKQYGSEILRLWVALSHYQSDQNISDDILKQVSEQYRKIRNTIRFLLANSAKAKQDMLKKDELEELDRWILNACDNALNEAYGYFDEYEFAKAFSIVMNFLTNELSGVYLDICKDVLYCDSLDSMRRRSCQSAIAVMLHKILHFIAPVLTHTASEAFDNATQLQATYADIFALPRIECKDYYDVALTLDFDYLLEVRAKFGEVLDRLKKDKIIKSSLEVLIAPPRAMPLLDRWLIVSSVCEASQDYAELGRFKLDNDDAFIMYKSPKGRCERCWQFVLDSSDSELCPRCQSALESAKGK